MTEAERRALVPLVRAPLCRDEVPAASFGRTYVVDFASLQKNLIVEVDGGQHADDKSDQRRTRRLEDQGFRILRFWNNEVLRNTNGVLEAIMIAATDPSPGALLRGAPPSPTRGEGNSHCEH